jgi:hypothetical protein
LSNKIELQLLGHLANKSFTMSGISMMCPSCNIKETFVSKDFEHIIVPCAILNSRSISSLKEEIQSSVPLLDLKVELDHLHTLVYELLKQDVNHKFRREKLDSKAVPSCNNC